MRSLFIILLLLFSVTCGVGFYRGWFTVDRVKIEEDEKKAAAEVRHLMQKAKPKAVERASDAKVPE
jgi:hypothetical protein